MTVIVKDNQRIIDLSHMTIPEDEEFKLNINTYFVDELFPQYKRDKDNWYIMQELEMSTHIGTHIESPFHACKEGPSISDIGLDKLIGDGVLLNFTNKKPDEEIILEELNQYDNKIKKDSIVLFYTGRDKYFGNKIKGHQRPYPTTEAIAWLVNKEIGCLGIDCTGIEVKGPERSSQPNHKLLFEKGIPLIENLTNLSEIKKENFKVFVLPVNIKGLESFPVRVIAIEENP